MNMFECIKVLVKIGKIIKNILKLLLTFYFIRDIL